MGAVVNMAPDLYEGVVSAVPFVDVVTTMLDPSIPLTTGNMTSGVTLKMKRITGELKRIALMTISKHNITHIF